MTKLNIKLKNFSIRLALLLAPVLSYAVIFLGAHTHNAYAATASIAISGNANIIYNHPVPTGTNFFKSLNISVEADKSGFFFITREIEVIASRAIGFDADI